MNGQITKNIETIIKINKNLNKNYVYDRVKDIKWDINKLAKTTEITINFNCNSKCKFCYFKPEDFKNTNTPTLTDISATLYNGIKNGEWIAVIIGGEPTLNKNIFKIGLIAKKIGYPCVKISTNGILLTKDYIIRLINSGYNMFDISIHSPDPQIHNKLVGIEGAFNKVINVCNYVKELNSELGTNIVINKLNYKNFPEFMDLTYNKLNINYYNIIFGHIRGMMKLNKNTLKIRYIDVLEYIKKGLEVISKNNMPLFARVLVNFPPCLLPEYFNIIADWENDEYNSSTLMVCGNPAINMTKMKNAQSTKTSKCKNCILNHRCRGLDKEYIKEFGDDEIKPLKEIPEQIFKVTF